MGNAPYSIDVDTDFSDLNTVFNQPEKFGSGLDPDTYVRLRQKIAYKKSEVQQNLRRLDEAIAPILAKDMKDSQDHLGRLQEQIQGTLQQLSAPPPLKPQAQFGASEFITAGIAGAMGIPIGDAVNGLYQMVQSRNDAQFQQELQKFGLNRETLLSSLEQLQKRHAGEEAHGRNLKMKELESFEAQAKLDIEEAKLLAAEGRAEEARIKTLRAGFASAKDPGTAEYHARLLEGTPYAVSEPELVRKIQELGNTRVKSFGTRLQALLTAFDVNPADLANLQAERAEIISDYRLSENDLPHVPTGQAFVEMRMQEQTRQYNETKKMKESQHKDLQGYRKELLADADARIAIARQNAQTAMTMGGVNAMAKFQMFQKQVDDETQKAIDRATVLYNKNLGNIGEFDELKKIKNPSKKQKERMKQLIAENANIAGQVRGWNQYIQEKNAERASVGLDEAKAFAGGLGLMPETSSAFPPMTGPLGRSPGTSKPKEVDLGSYKK